MCFYQKFLLLKKYLNTTLLEMFGNLQQKNECYKDDVKFDNIYDAFE